MTRQFNKFMDVDFRRESLRKQKSTGHLPNVAKPGTFRGIFEEAESIIPSSEWNDRINERDATYSWPSELITWVCDQDGEGSCVSNATTKQHEVIQARQFGMDQVVRLSPVSLYKETGSSPGSGSTLDDNISVISSRGVLPLDTAENKARFSATFPHNGFYTKYPSGYLNVCKLFTDHEYYDITSMEGFMTALLKGFPVLYARQGHCILGVRVFLQGSKRIWGYCNSWGNWGDRLNQNISYGMGYDSESLIRSCAYGSVALRSIKVSSAWSNPLSLASNEDKSADPAGETDTGAGVTLDGTDPTVMG